MKLRNSRTVRSGAAVVEAALVLPLLMLFLFGTIVGALFVFAADEVSAASREAARWASVRSATNATAADISAYALARTSSLDPNLVTCNVTWQAANRPGHYVNVEVRYDWPGIWPFPAKTLVGYSSTMITY